MKKISTLFIISLGFCICSHAQFVVFDDALAPNIDFVPFGGSVNDITVDNSVFYSGTSSLRVRVTTGYTGGAYVSSVPVNVTAYNALTFWMRVSAGGPGSAERLDGIGLGNPADGTGRFAIEANGMLLNTNWQKVIIPIPNPSLLTDLAGLFHFAEGSGGNNYDIWFDDIKYETVAPGSFSLVSARINERTLEAEVGSTFTPEGTRAIYSVSSVNQDMAVAPIYFTWQSSAPSVVSINTEGLGTLNQIGQATITGKLLETNAANKITVNAIAPLPVPTAAAPTPRREASFVKSLFSDAYPNNRNVTSWATDWSGCCRTFQDVMIAGDSTKKYLLRHFTGIEFDRLDASDMDSLHIDVWTPTASRPFTVRLVNDAGTTNSREAEIKQTLPVNQWVSLDLSLNQFRASGTGPVLPSRSQLNQILLLVDPETSGTFYIDNLYFFKANAPLPVNLTDFTVQRQGNQSLLTWKTRSEVNNKGFEVERSGDGTNWSKLTFVAADAGTAATKEYSATDLNPLAGINYYRLKQIDLDGTAAYSKVVSVQFADQVGAAFSFYPNPIQNTLQVQLQPLQSRNASLELYNAAGKMLKNIPLGQRNTASNLSVDVSAFTKGLYFITLKDGAVTQTSKLIIQ